MCQYCTLFYCQIVFHCVDMSLFFAFIFVSFVILFWYATSCLSFSQSVGGDLCCFHFWLLWTMLLQIFMYKFYVCVITSLGIYLGVELLDYHTYIHTYISVYNLIYIIICIYVFEQSHCFAQAAKDLLCSSWTWDRFAWVCGVLRSQDVPPRSAMMTILKENGVEEKVEKMEPDYKSVGVLPPPCD